MGFNSKPKLKKRTERGGKPEVYQYDHLPIEFRRQVIHLWISCIGSYSPTDFSRFLPPLENLVWDKIHNFLARNVGEFYFGNERYNSFAQCQYFLLDSNTPFDYLLKFIEYTFRFIENDLPRIRQRRYDELGEISYSFQSSEDAISELNHRFRQHNLGYQYNNGQIIRVDSVFIHTEVILPALSLLSNHDFQGAEEEFRNAHKHYRKQEYKDAIVDALNAFESTMKTICKKCEWSYSKTASAKELIKVLLENELIPKYIESYFASLRSLLESGVPTVRNKTSGHGQGEFPIDVPEYLAAYVLHLTASNIVLLVEAYQDKKINSK
jgi:hypothetical protein